MKKALSTILILFFSTYTNAWSIGGFLEKNPSFNDLYSNISYRFYIGPVFDPRFSDSCSKYLEITLFNATGQYIKGVDATCSLYDISNNRIRNNYKLEFSFGADIASGNSASAKRMLCADILNISDRISSVNREECKVTSIYLSK